MEKKTIFIMEHFLVTGTSMVCYWFLYVKAARRVSPKHSFDLMWISHEFPEIIKEVCFKTFLTDISTVLRKKEKEGASTSLLRNLSSQKYCYHIIRVTKRIVLSIGGNTFFPERFQYLNFEKKKKKNLNSTCKKRDS